MPLLVRVQPIGMDAGERQRVRTRYNSQWIETNESQAMEGAFSARLHGGAYGGAHLRQARPDPSSSDAMNPPIHSKRKER